MQHVVNRADHLAMDAWVAADRKAAGAARLRACARRRMKSAASSARPIGNGRPARVLGMCVLWLLLLPEARECPIVYKGKPVGGCDVEVCHEDVCPHSGACFSADPCGCPF